MAASHHLLEATFARYYTPNGAMAVRKSVTVRVPATSGNLGPGFDCLGLALSIWNGLSLRVGQGEGITITGEGSKELSYGPDNLVYRSILALFETAQVKVPPLSLHCRNSIPLGRGLGSSAAAVIGGIVAANALLEQPLNSRQLLDLAASLEGHSDNVAPALLGGCQVVVQSSRGIVTLEVPLPRGLHAVLFIPDWKMPTNEARAILPTSVPRDHAVFNLSRTALLVGALSTNRLDLLSLATEDLLHQPARQELFPAMRLILKAALEAGAVGAFLSGAGSTILGLTKGRQMSVGYEMANTADKSGISGDLRIVKPSRRGAIVTSIK